MNLEILHETVSHSLSGTMKFPQIVGLLMEQGVEAYHVDFVRAENRYYNAKGDSHVIPIPHSFLKAAQEFSAQAVSAAIKKSQQGQIDYPTFIEEVMRAGCVYYITYLSGRRVVYFGRNGDFHVEHFPGK